MTGTNRTTGTTPRNGVRRLETVAGPATILALLIVFSPAASAHIQRAAETEATASERVDAIFADYDNTRSPGCAVGVIDDGRFVLERGYGMANLEHGIPLTSDSVFRIGSTSKQFTAASVLLLVEEGRLSLDDDVRRYLPELTDFGSPVTIRHLIHHTSGYRDYLTLMSLAGRGDDDYYTDEEVLAMLARQNELNFAPGSEYLYSNSGYWLLSQLVARVSGQSLGEFAADRIFGPLGMGASHFHDDHTMLVDNRASGYAPTGAGGYRISMTTLPMVGDGGVFTTVGDLLAWDQNFYDSSIGSPSFIDTTLTVGVLDGGEELDYAFGLTIGTYRGLDTVSHGGSFVGFRAELLRFPDERLSVICLCNRADANPSQRARQVAEVFLGDKMEAQVDNGRRVVRRRAREPVELTIAELEAFEGEYYSVELDVAYRIDLVSEGLMLTVRNSPPRPLQATATRVLRVGNRTFRFEPGAAAGFSGFRLDAGRVRNLKFVRVQP